MFGKTFVIIGLMFLLITGLGFRESQAQGPQSGQAYSLDPELCALMLRKGKESFSRARYGEAKDFFRRAIQADPNSPKAWSHYDLAQMYSVAEQFKNHGRIVQSSAPTAEQISEATQPPSPVLTTPPPLPAKEKTKTIPAKKEKKEKTVKEKKSIPSEPPKAETAKPEAPKPIPAPAPTPGGFKILKDEGC